MIKKVFVYCISLYIQKPSSDGYGVKHVGTNVYYRLFFACLCICWFLLNPKKEKWVSILLCKNDKNLFWTISVLFYIYVLCIVAELVRNGSIFVLILVVLFENWWNCFFLFFFTMRYKDKYLYESAKVELRVSIQCGTHVLTYEKTCFLVRACLARKSALVLLDLSL